MLADEPRSHPPRRQLPDDPRVEIVTPGGTSGPAEWGRYHDAVREAARSYDHPGDAEVHQFLNARARHPERVDREAFTEAVHRQRMADLVDIADHHIRRIGSLPRGSRHIRVQAPKGYFRRALRNSTPEDLAHLRHRLHALGHSSEHVDKFLVDRVTPDVWDQASAIEVQAADDQFNGLYFDDEEPDFEWPEERPEIHIHIDKEALRDA